MDISTILKFETGSYDILINHPSFISDELADNTSSTIWPSSILLSLFLKIILPKNEPKSILELGAGLGLTALVTTKFCNVSRYFLQELPYKSIVEVLENNLSQLSKNKYQIITGKWGTDDLFQKIGKIDHIDELIMADCFYSKKNFIPLLSTISYIFRIKNELKRALCIYHHRNINDSIIKFLPVFNLDAKIIEWSFDLYAEIEKFKILNPELEHNKLLNFQDLFIIEFKRK